MSEQERDKITVYWGMEKLSPIQYQPFEFGGFHYTTSIREGETEEQAFERAYTFLDNMAKKQFPSKLKDFKERLREAYTVFKKEKK